MQRCDTFGLVIALLLLLGGIAQAQPNPQAPRVATASRQLVVEQIEVEGNTRTPDASIAAAARLTPGDPASPEAILAALERLRHSHVVREAQVHTRRGEQPGRIVVVFTVKETRPDFRLGLGYEDLSGWYLIPAQISFDNISGHAEQFDLSARVGFRVAGLVLTYRRPSLVDPRHFWELALRGEGQNRLYYLDQTEVAQHVDRVGADFKLGRPLTRHTALQGWATLEAVEVDSSAEVYITQEVKGRDKGDPVPYEVLPPEIQAAVGRTNQTRLGVSLDLDTRRGRGLLTRGLWGRTLGEVVFTQEADFGLWEWDLRGYVPLWGGMQLAARTRAGAVTDATPFYERIYLGGLYTVRGFPNQSLSPPEGNLRGVTGSLELRTTWIGTARDPRLVWLLFLDAGLGWNEERPDLDQGSAGVGYGLRLGLPWIRYVGLDVGHPLTASPVNEAFHLNLSIGWTF